MPQVIIDLMNDRARRNGIIPREARFFDERHLFRAEPTRKIVLAEDRVIRQQEIKADIRNNLVAEKNETLEALNEQDQKEEEKEESINAEENVLVPSVDNDKVVDDVDHSPEIEPEPPPVVSGRVLHPYNLRPRKKPEETVASTMIDKEVRLSSSENEINQAIKDELHQLAVDKEVLSPIPPSKLTDEDIRKALPTHMMVKRKYVDGQPDRLKGRCAAGGNHQDRKEYEWNETSSPTVALSSLFILLVVAMVQRMQSFNFDISGAYLNAKMERRVVVKFDRRLTKLLVELIPSWKRFVCPDSGVIYCVLMKALYGCIEASKLWYNFFNNIMLSMGFKPHAMDPCVFVRSGDTDDDLFIVCLYVDDGRGFCKKQALIDKFRSDLSSAVKATFDFGLRSQYLGMIIDVSTEGETKIEIPKIIEGVLSTLKIDGKSKLPHGEDLFEVDPLSPPLDSRRAKIFYSVVYKLLWCSMRTEVRILVAVNFLTGRVQNPLEQDWEKLLKILHFLNATERSIILLKPTSRDWLIEWFIDVAYAIRENRKSQTGDVGFLCGAFIGIGTGKQRINVKSSAEGELVGASDRLGKAIWCRNFLIWLGFIVPAIRLREDNKAVIHLLLNGYSNSERTRHVDIRYFWIHDCVINGTVSIVWVCSAQQLADSLSKPTTGKLFQVHFDVITGVPLKYIRV